MKSNEPLICASIQGRVAGFANRPMVTMVLQNANQGTSTNSSASAEYDKGSEHHSGLFRKFKTVKSSVLDGLDSAALLLLRNETVFGAAKKVDEFISVATDHRPLAALALLDIDLPVAFPIAAEAIRGAYGYRQMIGPVEVTDIAALFAFEYAVVSGSVAAYKKLRSHFISIYCNSGSAPHGDGRSG